MTVAAVELPTSTSAFEYASPPPAVGPPPSPPNLARLSPPSADLADSGDSSVDDVDDSDNESNLDQLGSEQISSSSSDGGVITAIIGASGGLAAVLIVVGIGMCLYLRKSKMAKAVGETTGVPVSVIEMGATSAKEVKLQMHEGFEANSPPYSDATMRHESNSIHDLTWRVTDTETRI